MELPGSSLQKACRLLVVFCALHLSAVLFYYLRGNTLSHQRSPEPPPRSQTFGRRVTEADLSGNISKPAADCPDSSPLLSLDIVLLLSNAIRTQRKANWGQLQCMETKETISLLSPYFDPPAFLTDFIGQLNGWGNAEQ